MSRLQQTEGLTDIQEEILATVDVDDTDVVVDVYIDRLLTLQIEDGLPLYVVPRRLHPQRVLPSPAGE